MSASSIFIFLFPFLPFPSVVVVAVAAASAKDETRGVGACGGQQGPFTRTCFRCSLGVTVVLIHLLVKGRTALAHLI